MTGPPALPAHPMKISQRAQSIAPFFAMEVGKRAAELEAQGHRVIKLNIGEPDEGAPPAVLQALHDTLDSAPLGYTGALGLPALREAISGFYRDRHGVSIDPGRIVVTAGASAALLLAAAALVDAGDDVLVGDPSYPCNRQFMAGFGANVRLVPTTAATRYQLDIDLVRSHWRDETRGVIVATPSNPTGTSIPPAELDAICAWARAHGAWRIVDEIYLDLADSDAQGRPPRSVLAVDDGAIVVNSFSKYFGMTGWRLGWCVVPAELAPAMERLAQNYYICPSTLAQHAALACFSAESLALCEGRRAGFSQRRQQVLAGLARIGLPVPVAPDGAFYVYIDVSGTGLEASRFCELALEQAHVALTPGRDFGHCSADTHVRLSYAAAPEELAEGIARLGHFLDRLQDGSLPR